MLSFSSVHRRAWRSSAERLFASSAVNHGPGHFRFVSSRVASNTSRYTRSSTRPSLRAPSSVSSRLTLQSDYTSAATQWSGSEDNDGLLAEQEEDRRNGGSDQADENLLGHGHASIDTHDGKRSQKELDRENAKPELQSNQLVLTPSEKLTEALREAGHVSSLPYQRPDYKVDLTFTSPRTPRASKVLHGRKAISRRSPVSLQLVLAEYIRICATRAHVVDWKSPTEDDVQQIFSRRCLRFLQRQGHTPEDVVSWAWIITAETSEMAAKRLLAMANSTSDPARYPRNKVPVFVYLYLLRRTDIKESALRLLLVHAWNMIRNTHNSNWEDDILKPRTDKSALRYMRWVVRPKRTGNYTRLESSTLAILIVRLLRHARVVWPDCMPHIAKLLTVYHDPYGPGVKMNAAELSRLTFLHNRILRLISLPTNKNPLLSVQYRQRALLLVLRRMSEFTPAVPITREGYRAVVRLQLSHRKTATEREWAWLKAKSWPPWKEDKSGLDESKGVELGISRARQSLFRATEAGYAMQPWEQAASILAGWDIDESPTIQTRTVFQRPAQRQNVTEPAFGAETALVTGRDKKAVVRGSWTGQSGDELVWAARIKATRTVEEAWACFLMYKEGKTSWDSEVCFSMYVKLVLARQQKLPHTFVLNDAAVVAGDSIEVWQSSQNPREQLYLKVPPPDEHQFIDEALKHDVSFYGRFLAFMLSHADTLGVGIQYIRISALPQKLKEALLARTSEDLVKFQSHDYPILAAFIRLLTNFAGDADFRRRARIHDGMTEPGNVVEESSEAGLVFARRLLIAHKYPYRPAWYDLLGALARKGARPVRYSHLYNQKDQLAHDLVSWNIMQITVRSMNEFGVSLDFDGFHFLCVGLEKATRAALRIVKQKRTGIPTDKEAFRQKRAQYVLANGTKELKAMFLRIALAHTPQVSTAIEVDDPTLWGSVADRQDTITTQEQEDQSRLDAAADRELSISIKSDPDQAPGASTDHISSDTEELNLKAEDMIPRLLEIPSPAHLHAFMRNLGWSRDHAGVVDLLGWMSFFAPEIEALCNELRNGQRLMRRTLICARVVLEDRANAPFASGSYAEAEPMSEDEAPSDFPNNSANREGGLSQPPSLVQQANAIVENVEQWGGWPTDDECDTYLSHPREGLSTVKQLDSQSRDTIRYYRRE